jgi:bacillithiol biosynthesis cysteine-adding enzyme BshC
LTSHEDFRPKLSGELFVKSECLPFTQIPHSSRIFTDFLSRQPQVNQFYPRSAFFADWFKEEASLVKYDSARREKVAAILERQNKNWGASGEVANNIARFRSGALALVTGQQVGLFGGPAFSIYKALTAAKLANLATEVGVDCVPVFWMATEDHDLAEVNHFFVPEIEGLRQVTTQAQGVPNAPVGTIVFDEEIHAVLESSASFLGESDLLSTLRDSYRPGETFGSAFARLFARLFADWGVILLDPSDPEFHAIAAPLFRAAIEQADRLEEALLDRGKELEIAGYHQQVKVTPSSSFLFAIHDSERTPVHRRENETERFVIGKEEISRSQLLNRIAASPQDFNPNVLLRPVVQDYLLPTLAYAGGPAEVAYFAQAGVVYEKLLGRVTPIVPRFSATIVDSKLRGILDRFQLKLADLFEGPEAAREKLAAAALSTELQSNFEQASVSLQKYMGAIRESLARLDKTLVDAADNAESKIRHQLETLQGRAARAELRQSEVLTRKAAFLSNALYPNKNLQEREIAGVYFLARHGTQLLRDLYDSIHPECVDHQIISLG